MRELAHVDLGGEVAPDRPLECLVGGELATGQRPAAGAGVEGALPEEHGEAAVAHLEDGCQDGVGRWVCFRPGIGNHVDSWTGYRL